MPNLSKRIIKKYPNRRLYDTEASAYITLEEVKQFILEKIDIQVIDAKTDKDLTTHILLQIVLEIESLDKPILTYEVLTQLIRFYGLPWQQMVGGYLEKNMSMLMNMQEKWLEQYASHQNQDMATKQEADWDESVKDQFLDAQNIMNQQVEQSAQSWIEMQKAWQEKMIDLPKKLTTSFWDNPFFNSFVEPEITEQNVSSSDKASDNKTN